MKKKLACIILAISIFAGTTVYSAEGVVAKKEVTLENAIEYSLEHNRDLRGIDQDIKKANIGLKNARDAKRMLDKTKDFPMARDYEITERAMKGYFVLQAEQAIELLERHKQQTSEKLKYDIEKLFYDIQLAEERAKSVEQGIKRLSAQIEVEELKLKLGMSMDFVLDMVKNQKAMLESQLNTLNYAIDSYYALLRSKLDISPSEELEIVQKPLDYKQYTLRSSDDAYTLALENRLDVLAMKQRVALLEFDFNLLDTYYTRGFKTYDNVKIDLAKAKDDFNALQNGIEDRLKLLYEDVKIKDQEYKNKNSALNTGEFNYKIAKLKHALGMLSKLELEDERLKFMNLQIDKLSALHNYILAVKMYELSYGCGY